MTEMNIDIEGFFTACMNKMTSQIEERKIEIEEAEKIVFNIFKSLWIKRTLEKHKDAFSNALWALKKKTRKKLESQDQAVNK